MPDVRLIDANALEAKLKEAYEVTEYGRFLSPYADAINALRSEVMSMPTIDAQPVKHGHWIRKAIFYVCSECGIELIDDNFEQIAIFPKGYMPFCPNCCAKMDGDTDGNKID